MIMFLNRALKYFIIAMFWNLFWLSSDHVIKSQQLSLYI
jgi:hypothetical protein